MPETYNRSRNKKCRLPVLPRQRAWCAVAGLCAALIGGAGAFYVGFPVLRAEAKASSPEAAFPYHGAVFSSFVADSFKNAGSAENPAVFYEWMDRALAGKAVRQKIAPEAKTDAAWTQTTWAKVIAVENKELSSLKGAARAKRERVFCASLHRAVKASIPKFSLDRGFEFTNTVKSGERQCFLQSVLVAGVLQGVGVNTGVAMVYRNDKGQATNNGHAVPVAHLSDGKDIIVDCSDPTPFIEHKGLFLRDARSGNYRYVGPQYAPDHTITAYQSAADNRKLTTRSLQGLDTAFLRSQFEYYRGERAPGGLLASHATTAGLADAAKHLRKSVQYCPNNPLSEYLLGLVYYKGGRHQEARRQFDTAYRLYATSGWVPPGERSARQLVMR